MTRQAQTNVTDEVAHLQLRPQMSDSVASLKAEMQTVSDNLATVRTVMSCASVHVIFKRAKSAVRSTSPTLTPTPTPTLTLTPTLKP